MGDPYGTAIADHRHRPGNLLLELSLNGPSDRQLPVCGCATSLLFNFFGAQDFVHDLHGGFTLGAEQRVFAPDAEDEVAPERAVAVRLDVYNLIHVPYFSYHCRQCEVRYACNGECPKHRFLTTPDGEPGLNYLCAGYRKFFNHVDPYMRTMTHLLRARKAPAGIMEMLRQQAEESV